MKGKRIEFTGTVVKVNTYSKNWNARSATRRIVLFHSDDGRRFRLEGNGGGEFRKGDRVTMRATVKWANCIVTAIGRPYVKKLPEKG